MSAISALQPFDVSASAFGLTLTLSPSIMFPGTLELDLYEKAGEHTWNYVRSFCTQLPARMSKENASFALNAIIDLVCDCGGSFNDTATTRIACLDDVILGLQAA